MRKPTWFVTSRGSEKRSRLKPARENRERREPVHRPADGVAAGVPGEERRVKAYLAEPGFEPGLAPDEVVAMRADDEIDALGHELREELSRLEPRDAGPLGGVAQPVGEEPTSAQRRHADLDAEDLLAEGVDPIVCAHSHDI
jgi:hypothetical protein